MQSTQIIDADRTLLPALTSVIINACEAAVSSENKQVDITASVHKQTWCLRICNEGKALSKQQIALLGSRLLPSQHGRGIKQRHD